jgi:Fic family protein
MQQHRVRLDQRLYERLLRKKAQLDHYQPLSATVMQNLYEHLRVLLTYHSNAIEGNTLTLAETKLVVEYGLATGDHTVREYREATNHAMAWEAVTRLAQRTEPITLDTVLHLHRLVMHDLRATAGTFRTDAVFITGTDYRPPPAKAVPQMMREWLDWIEGAGRSYPPVVRAAIAHHDFEAVHPFDDGNGRVGRLLLNLLLMRDGYAPALLLRDWRMAYIRALQHATDGEYTPIANVVGRAAEGGLDLYLSTCADLPEHQYVPLAALAKANKQTPNYLGDLVRKGRLQAHKRRGRWYSTQHAWDHYRAEVTAKRFPVGRPRHARDVLADNPADEEARAA